MRVLSYNIHKGIGGRDRRYDLARIVATVEEQNPDLICLQEVDQRCRRSSHDDQPHMLAERFHAAAQMYQMNFHLRSGGGYGNLLLSRWPLSAHHQISLRLRQRKPRGAQIAIIDTPEGTLRLVNMHLGLQERERHWQIEHLLGHHLFASTGELPTLLIGDLNDWRNRLHRTALRREGYRQVSAPPSRFRSFPAWLPVGSLDKAFCSGAIEVTHARVAHSRPARDASDHLPLVIDFHLRPRASPGDRD
ncbi:MAG: endonuclease/exonuclease/phosphatase family protein [Planctomycetes bacterium]|nr:endonuclease/exonuclease/phosphatase family protein [Planctomycetota bacterium]